MIDFNSDNPVYVKARQESKPLELEEVHELVSFLDTNMKNNPVFAGLLQRLIFDYENLKHFFNVVGGWEGLENIKQHQWDEGYSSGANTASTSNF
ncbi:MAG TPA: hypothetical protein VEA58_05415 [Anaerovoracaceae bacterium]|nr:hypothetical protein [Anaerovoracaceae bacterium]